MATRRTPKKPVRAKGRREIAFTNPQKVYFPGTGMTKGEVIQYYIDVAQWMVPHLRDRPVTLIRFPDGVGGKSFYEKNAPGFTPDWVQRFEVPRRRHEGSIDYILINDVETLAWCANLGAIELHPFLHRAPDLDRPTHIAFDLDPGENANLLTCIEVAFHLRRLFERFDLEAYPKVSGSKGLQLYVPLNTPVTYDVTQPFAKAVAEAMEKQFPQLVVSNMTKTLRKKRVLIDWSQNSQSKTTVSVYALRGKRPEPYVSMAVSWAELERASKKKDLDALFFTPADALRRLEKEGDLFAPVLTTKQKLPKEAWNGDEPPPPPSRRKKPSAQRSLQTYAAKRDFSRTQEPPPRPTRSRQGSRRRFVIQKHAASHLHYDFRLEMEDTLKSWAVPKGLPYALDEKRSAFATEDHPLEYLDFEGTIPAGQYGGGTVMVWDIGTYDVLDGNYWKGRLRVQLSGEKLRGEWHLYRIREDDGKATWLVEKRDRAHRVISARRDDKSVLTDRTMAQIAADNDRQWQSHREPARSDPPAPADVPTATAASKKAAQRPRATSPRKGRRRGMPLAFFEPMAAKLVSELPAGPEWLYEVKWDGYRALAIKEGDEVRLLSRRNNSLAGDFPEIVEAVREVNAERAILDGEIVALDASGRPSFHALQHRSERQDVSLVFYAFDLLHLDGEDLASLPLMERKQQLEAVVSETRVLYSAELPGEAADVVAAVAQVGLEGVVAKRRDASYEPGERSGAWKKMKIALEQEFVVGGYKPSARSFETLLVGTYQDGQLMYAGKVRAGFDPRSRAAVAAQVLRLTVRECPFANLPETKSGRWGEGVTAADMETLKWVKPQQVIQVGFVEWTRQGHLRHATFRGLRPDKRARDVVREDTAA